MRSGMNIFNFMRSSRSRRKKAPLHYVTPQSAGRRRSRSYRVGVLYLLFALIAVGAAFGLKLPDQATLAAWGVPGIAMPAPTVEGRATVTDGDTVQIGRHRIRLHGIDAPESQPYCTPGSRQYACGTNVTQPQGTPNEK